MKSTGNSIVDLIGQINISGNVIPQSWFKTIIRDNGKPNLSAIVILSDIVYWYRPTEIRDEQTGQTIAMKKKFKSDLLQRSYNSLSEQFGISKREATNAVTALEQLGVVKKHFRTVVSDGVPHSNVLFIELIPDVLYRITYPENEIAITLESEMVSPSKVIGVTSKSETYTEITTEITTENKKIYTPEKEKVKKKAKEPKHKHGEYNHVLLTDKELDKLKADYPNDYQTMIRDLDEYLEMHPSKSYANHNLTMRRWKRKDEQEQKPKKAIEQPIPAAFDW